MSEAKAQTITEDQQLSFGNLLVDNGASTIEVRTNGSIRVNTGTAIIISGGARAEFTISGPKNADVNFTLPSSFTLSGPGTDMTVDNIVTNRNSPFGLGGQGSRTLFVGGILNINSNQTGGNYSGSYTLTVNLQ